MRRCGSSGAWAGLGLAVVLAFGSVQTALAAGRRTLEPKLHGDIPGGVFTSVARVEGTETSGNSVVLEDGRLYFGAAHTLYVYDVAKPLKPRLLGSVGGIGAIRQMAVWKGMVYIASRETGMWIVDARNPSAPKLLSRFDTIELATGISVCGNLVMLGQRQNGVVDGKFRFSAVNVHFHSGITAESPLADRTGEATFLRIDEVPREVVSSDVPRTVVSREAISTDTMYPGAAPFPGAKSLVFKVEPRFSGKATVNMEGGYLSAVAGKDFCNVDLCCRRIGRQRELGSIICKCGC